MFAPVYAEKNIKKIYPNIKTYMKEKLFFKEKRKNCFSSRNTERKLRIRETKNCVKKETKSVYITRLTFVKLIFVKRWGVLILLPKKAFLRKLAETLMYFYITKHSAKILCISLNISRSRICSKDKQNK